MATGVQCPTCGRVFGITGVQYQGTTEDYDGVSEFRCEACGTRWGRWTKRILTGDDIEGRYGRQPRSAPVGDLRGSKGA